MSLLNSPCLRSYEYAGNLLTGAFRLPPWCAHQEDSPAHPAAPVPEGTAGQERPGFAPKTMVSEALGTLLGVN